MNAVKTVLSRLRICEIQLAQSDKKDPERIQGGILAVKKNESARRLLLCINAVLQKKAKDIVVLNVKNLSAFADYLLVCSGATDRQVRAIADAIRDYLKKEKILPLGVEGESNAQWILLDYDDVVISVFQEETRSFYKLEDLWDAPRMDVDENATQIKTLTREMA